MNQRFLLTLWLTVLTLPMSAYVYGQDTQRDADVPLITSLIEQRDGTTVKLSFLALHWNKELMDTLKFSKERRDYFNTYYGSKMGLLTTSVKLKFSPLLHIDAGEYFLGLKINEPLIPDGTPSWSMLISPLPDPHVPIITRPLNAIQEPAVTEHLSFVFTPGITDRDFMFNMSYGNISVNARWTVVGIPTRAAEGQSNFKPAWDQIPLPGIKNSAPPDIIQPATPAQIRVEKKPAVPPKPKRKAGSGSLRYLKDKQKEQSSNQNEKDNQSN